MRFEKEVHWAEGLFLQPHHLQKLQRSLHLKSRIERSFYLPYTYGIIDFEIDQEALKNCRVVIKRLSAIMPSGVEISMPGNAVIPALDVTSLLQDHNESIMIYLTLPLWSGFDGNINDEVHQNRLFLVHDENLRDENSGDNEIIVAHRRLNVRLTTEQGRNEDVESIPLLKLKTLYKEVSDASVNLDQNYIPPYIVVSADCPLLSMIFELKMQIQNRKNKLLSDFAVMGYTPDVLSGGVVQNMLQLRTLSCYDARLSSLLSDGRITPFGLYLELRSLLAELSALQPVRDLGIVDEYNHLDCYAQFSELLLQIRALILIEGSSSYVKLPFVLCQNGTYMQLTMRDENILTADEYYLAVRYDGESRQLIHAVETGDNFKLVNPKLASMRVRGVKMTEVRYPPRFLPALQGTIWFKLERQESARIWQEICDERAMLLDWAHELFPKMEAELYITILTKGESK